ncbi:MAG: hypothetical protein EBV83_06775 [Verrucomicrobia bacterium]|nr:hypothetical protein [Verrucomicrobiota bacterium]
MRAVVLVVLWLSVGCPGRADESPGEAKNIYGVLMQGIQDGDVSVFQELGNEAFRKQMTPEFFQSCQAKIGMRLRDGYCSSYLGKISKNQREIFLWKIIPQKNQEQLLVTLVLEDNKVEAFYFQ